MMGDSGVASIANATDAVAEAARRVHDGEAQAVEEAVGQMLDAVGKLAVDSRQYAEELRQKTEQHCKELTEAALALTEDAKEFSSQLRAEGSDILERIRAKTQHVQQVSADIRQRINKPADGANGAGKSD